jgi:hypothetical protein
MTKLGTELIKCKRQYIIILDHLDPKAGGVPVAKGETVSINFDTAQQFLRWHCVDTQDDDAEDQDAPGGANFISITISREVQGRTAFVDFFDEPQQGARVFKRMP